MRNEPFVKFNVLMMRIDYLPSNLKYLDDEEANANLYKFADYIEITNSHIKRLLEENRNLYYKWVDVDLTSNGWDDEYKFFTLLFNTLINTKYFYQVCLHNPHFKTFFKSMFEYLELWYKWKIVMTRKNKCCLDYMDISFYQAREDAIQYHILNI